MNKTFRTLLLLGFIFIVSCRTEKGLQINYEPEGPFKFMDGSYLSEEAPNFQCMLSKDLGDVWTSCSGTFIDDNTFLTAAHCIQFDDFTAVPQNVTKYEINCFSSKKIAVKSLHVHPFYYKRESWPASQDELYSPPDNIMSTNVFYDQAIVITDEDVSFSSYPLLSKNSFKVSEYDDESCRMLGFSSRFCDTSSGVGCYRDKFSVVTSEVMSEYGCTYNTGEGCQTRVSNSSLLKDFPLMIELGNKDVKGGREIFKGDSGAGLLCSREGQEYLAGIVVRVSNNEVINLGVENDFVQLFLDTPLEERSSQFVGFELDPNYRTIVEEFHIVEDFMKRIQVELYYPEERQETTVLTAPGTDYIEAFLEIRDWIETNPSEPAIKDKKGVSIVYTASPDSPVSIDPKHPNVTLVQIDGADNFYSMLINSKARPQEIIEFLKN